MAFHIRDAREDDVPALARLHEQTFTETHRDGRPGGPTYELRERQWREAFAGADDRWFCVVVEDESKELVGFAKGTPHDGGVPGFAGELNKIYVLRRLHGRGLGRHLLSAVARRFVERGVGSMLLFGDSANPSNGFYEAFGAERLFSDRGEFHGGYGWRDLGRLIAVTNPIRFDDGAAYERYMGTWSQRVGEAFLDWLAPPSGLRWLDVGCGTAAFSEMIVERCAPAFVQGIDPSEAQLTYARARLASGVAQFRRGDAMALPFPDDTFDAAVMPLVIFFVPDPAKGVAEMARVVCPGGIVAAYAWDMTGGGFPYDALKREMGGLGVDVPEPPSPDASGMDALRNLWTGAGLEAVETREITVERTFVDFNDYWTTILGGPSMGPQLAAMASEDLALLQTRMRASLPADAAGRITYSARANAVKGRP